MLKDKNIDYCLSESTSGIGLQVTVLNMLNMQTQVMMKGRLCNVMHLVLGKTTSLVKKNNLHGIKKKYTI